LSEFLLTSRAFGGILLTQIVGASKRVADLIAVGAHVRCAVKEPVLAASRQRIRVANSNEQQQQRGWEDVVEPLEGAKLHAEISWHANSINWWTFSWLPAAGFDAIQLQAITSVFLFI